MQGPTLPISQELHAEKYRSKNESFREACSRVAGALQDSPKHFQEFREILLDMRFLPAGRVQSAMGTLRAVTPYNCYVSADMVDSMVDGPGSIMACATEAAATMRQGGGIGYDFSSLRPRGDLIKKLDSKSSGPVSFMHIFDSICKCIASSGHRRGAQMGVLRIDHPDVEEFLRCKQPAPEVSILWEIVERMPDSPEKHQAWAALQKTLDLTGFNISVGVTDEFMHCLKSGKGFDLKFNGQVYKTVDASALWDMLMRGTWDWAEPGVLFIDTINNMNNLWYCETIKATNPCGEQPLPGYGACLLGSFNFVKYVVTDSQGRHSFDLKQLLADVPAVIRAMDNIVDRAKYPLRSQEKEAKNKRRMGMGATGVANAFEACGFKYGSTEFVEMENNVLRALNQACYEASVRLASEKGCFPLFERDSYLEGTFIQSLDEGLVDEIGKYGIRNSHLTSIAPTGTISLTADNVSSGIEPVFSYSYDRIIQTFEGPKTETVTDYGMRVFGVKGKQANDVTVDEHLSVLLAAAKNVDSAVSKTCNVPGNVSWTDFKNLYVRAYEGGAKGCTTFRIDGKRMGILTTTKE
jgi:ribonucleoside-diphosphate reductase alpha chain